MAADLSALGVRLGRALRKVVAAAAELVGDLVEADELEAKLSGDVGVRQAGAEQVDEGLVVGRGRVARREGEAQLARQLAARADAVPAVEADDVRLGRVASDLHLGGDLRESSALHKQFEGALTAERGLGVDAWFEGQFAVAGQP